MTTENRSPLELDVVVRRFVESADALSNVREQLQVLTRLGEAEERVNANLNWTAGQFERFAQDAAGVLRGLKESRTKVAKDAVGMLSALKEAQSKLSDALSNASDLMDGTELKGISEAVKANSQVISTIDERVTALGATMSELSGRMTSITEQAQANSQAITGLGNHIAALDASVSETSGKIKRVPVRVDTELRKRNEELVKANQKAISSLEVRLESRANSRISALESRVSELTRMVEVMQADIGNVHADVKEPIIVKRFF